MHVRKIPSMTTTIAPAIEYALVVDHADGAAPEIVPAQDAHHAAQMARTIYAARACRVVGREVNPWRYVTLTPATALGAELAP